MTDCKLWAYRGMRLIIILRILTVLGLLTFWILNLKRTEVEEKAKKKGNVNSDDFEPFKNELESSLEFRQVTGNFRSELEKWSIQTDSQEWFNNILDNPHFDTLTTSSAVPSGIVPFSQPNPTAIGPRFNTFSQ